MPSRIRLRAPAGIVVRRRDLAPVDRTVRRGLGVTAPALTVLDTAVEQGSAFLDRARQRHVRLADLQQVARRRFAGRGTAAARAMVAVAATGGESQAERVAVGLLRSAGLTGWVLGHRFGPWTLDIAFPDLRVAIEIDGWAWHRDVERFRSDARKGNALTGAGWILLRFTWHDLNDDPAAVLAAVIRATGQHRAPVTGAARSW